MIWPGPQAMSATPPGVDVRLLAEHPHQPAAPPPTRSMLVQACLLPSFPENCSSSQPCAPWAGYGNALHLRLHICQTGLPENTHLLTCKIRPSGKSCSGLGSLLVYNLHIPAGLLALLMYLMLNVSHMGTTWPGRDPQDSNPGPFKAETLPWVLGLVLGAWGHWRGSRCCCWADSALPLEHISSLRPQFPCTLNQQHSGLWVSGSTMHHSTVHHALSGRSLSLLLALTLEVGQHGAGYSGILSGSQGVWLRVPQGPGWAAAS